MSQSISADVPSSLSWRSWLAAGAALALLSACKPAIDSANAMSAGPGSPPRWPPQTAPLMAGQTAPGRTVGL